MMNSDERFSKYFLNDMNENEKQEFENELKSSEQFRIDFEDYKKVFELVNETKQVKLEDSYSQLIIPNFRKNLEKNKQKLALAKFGYAFSFLFIVIFGYMIFNSVFNNSQDLNKTYSGLTSEDVNLLANDVNIDLENNYDEEIVNKIDSVYSDKLKENIIASISDDNLVLITDDVNINKLDQYLSNKDIDYLYAELSDKEFL